MTADLSSLAPKHERFQRSPETDAALGLLRACPEGESITYAQIRIAAKVDAGKSRDVLRRAVDIVLREGIAFINEQGVGYRRLRDGEIAAETGPTYRKRVRQASRKEKAKLGCVKDYSSLTEDQRVQWNTEAVMASAFELLASTKVADKVAIEVDEKLKYSLATEGVLKQLKKT